MQTGAGKSYRTGARVTLSKSQHARELLEEIPTCASNRGCFPHAPDNTPTRFPILDKLSQQRWGRRKFTKRVGNIKNTNALQIFHSAPLPNMLQQIGARCATACLHPREDAYASGAVRLLPEAVYYANYAVYLPNAAKECNDVGSHLLCYNVLGCAVRFPGTTKDDHLHIFIGWLCRPAGERRIEC